MGGNPLVDPKSQFNPDDYFPNFDKIAKGDLGTASPVTEGGDWFKGVSVIEDAEQLGTALANGSATEQLTALITVGIDMLGVAMDPIGSALSMLMNWMIEHLKPLRLALDSLAGNPAMVEGEANTWSNISKAMTSSGNQLLSSLDPGTSSWHGTSAEVYRFSAEAVARSMGAIGQLTDGISGLVKLAGLGVATVRTTVRDLITTLVSELIVDAIEEAATLGLGTPLVVEQALGSILRCSTKVAKAITTLVKILDEVNKILPAVWTLITRLIEIFKLFPQASKATTSVPG